MHGTNICGITKTNWPKPHTNSVTPRRIQDDRCTLEIQATPPSQATSSFGFIIPCLREWHTCLRHHENQLARTTHQQRDSTRNQNDRCTLRSRRLHPLKPQIQPPICGGRLVLAVSTKNKTTGTNTPRIKSISSRAARLQAIQQNHCVLRSKWAGASGAFLEAGKGVFGRGASTRLAAAPSGECGELGVSGGEDDSARLCRGGGLGPRPCKEALDVVQSLRLPLSDPHYFRISEMSLL